MSRNQIPFFGNGNVNIAYPTVVRLSSAFKLCVDGIGLTITMKPYDKSNVSRYLADGTQTLLSSPKFRVGPCTMCVFFDFGYISSLAFGQYAFPSTDFRNLFPARLRRAITWSYSYNSGRY